MIGYDEDTFAVGEIIGYTTMIFSLMFIVVAGKSYRNANPDKVVGFKELFLLGAGISLIAGIMFGLYHVFYVYYLDPAFMDNYYNYSIENIRNSGISEAEFNQRVAEIESEKALFMNPFFNFLLMFLTVFVIGLVVSVVSGLFQRDRNEIQS